jgi:hypothetical protein
MPNPSSQADWITGNTAIEASRRGLRISKDPAIADALLEGAEPTTATLVERLDKPGVAYYLVLWDIGVRHAIIVQVDALTGVTLEFILLTKDTSLPFLEDKEAAEYITDIFPGRAISKLRLVWEPCQESTSPMYPLFEVQVNGIIVYVRMDGFVHHRLTPLGFGG